METVAVPMTFDAYNYKYILMRAYVTDCVHLTDCIASCTLCEGVSKFLRLLHQPHRCVVCGGIYYTLFYLPKEHNSFLTINLLHKKSHSWRHLGSLLLRTKKTKMNQKTIFVVFSSPFELRPFNLSTFSFFYSYSH